MIRAYQKKGITVVAINSNDFNAHPDDSPKHMQSVAKQFGFTFPFLIDESQDVAKAYRASCTPDFFLFDADKSLVYRGQFDQARPGNNITVTGSDLSAAIESLVSGKPVAIEQKSSMGCNIKWKPDNAPDYF
jgi:glutathione peroxidase-family protein